VTEPTRPDPCPRCHVVHAPKDAAIVIQDPDDEIFGCGSAHIERMSKHAVYVGLYAADGSFAQVYFTSSKGKLLMHAERHDG
jgi:hypothetical protein